MFILSLSTSFAYLGYVALGAILTQEKIFKYIKHALILNKN